MARQRARIAASATALLLLIAPGLASAEIPIGMFEIDLGGNHSIWLDAADDQDEFCEGFAEGFGGTLQSCSLSMSIDGKGKISGSVAVSAENAGVVVSLDGPIKGKLKGDGQTGLTNFSFSIKLAGEVSDGLMMADVNANASFAGQITGAGLLTGDWSLKFCAKGGGCFSEMEAQPPESLDGGWTLVLEIADLGGGKLGGSATAELGDGTPCPYAISGKYSAKNDLASLKLSPTNATCAGTSISLQEVQLAGLLTAQMKYKLFGKQGETSVESVDF